jgi:hypothetical protein
MGMTGCPETSPNNYNLPYVTSHNSEVIIYSAAEARNHEYRLSLLPQDERRLLTSHFYMDKDQHTASRIRLKVTQWLWQFYCSADMDECWQVTVNVIRPSVCVCVCDSCTRGKKNRREETGWQRRERRFTNHRRKHVQFYKKQTKLLAAYCRGTFR